MEYTKVDKNLPVIQSNKIIESRYRLTKNEQKFLRIMIAMIRKDDKDFEEYIFSISDLAGLLGINTKGAYRDINRTVKKLMSRVLSIHDENKNSDLIIAFLSSAEYKRNEGKIAVCFDPKLKPYLLELKSKYTQYKLENVLYLGSGYAIRIYELGKMYLGIELHKRKKRGYSIKNITVSEDISYTDLRELFMIKNNEYERIYDFIKKTLTPAVKEINEHTDLNFKWERIKQGRGGKVVGFTFTFSLKKGVNFEKEGEEIALDNTLMETLRRLRGVGIMDVTIDTISKWVAKYSNKQLETALEIAEENHAKGKEVGAGLIVSALKNSWSSDLENTKQEKKKIEKKRNQELDKKQLMDTMQKMKDEHSMDNTAQVRQWFSVFNESEKDQMRAQYLETLTGIMANKEKKAKGITQFYLAYLTKEYKKRHTFKKFTVWLEEYGKKNGIEITPQMLEIAEEIN